VFGAAAKDAQAVIECEDYADIGTIDAEDLKPRRLIGLTLAELGRHVFPDRRPIFLRGDTVVFRAGHLGQVYAERGFGKTWFLQTLALIAASGGSALGFSSPEPIRVLNIDGEMASREIQERTDLLVQRLEIPSAATITTVAADWQEDYLPRLDTPGGQAAIEPFIEDAELVILDNRSCLFDPDGEKDPSAWQATQEWLLSLRRRGKAVLLAHHSNRMGGARGHSKAEDPMNLLIKLSRPEDYQQDQGARFIVTFDKSRGAYGAAVAPFLAHLTPEGWKTTSADGFQKASAGDKLLEYLRLAHEAGERPKSANAAIGNAHIGRNAGLVAWAELLKAGAIRKHPDGGFFAP
jgi:putative DNA primase/helicase